MLNTPGSLLKLSLTLPLVVVAALGVGCPEGSGPGSTPIEREPTVIGEDIDPTACETDVDCPLDFFCDPIGRCRAIDNDADNDGYDAAVDCDDANPARHPGRPEVCNGIDDDCDNETDEGVANACGTCGAVPDEVCDLIDNDCDDLVDEECQAGNLDEQEPNDGANCQPAALPAALGATLIYDGAFNPAGDVDSYCFFVRAGTRLFFDVDSASLGAPTDGVLSLLQENGAQFPGGSNDFGDGPDPELQYTFPRDENVRLDLFNFETDQGGANLVYQLKITLEEEVACVDNDGDGRSGCDGDCNDDDGLIFPGQTEVCDGIDNDCNELVDSDAIGGCPNLARPELEPNNTREQCVLLTAPFDIDGVISPSNDKDVFCVFVSSGTELGFDIDAKEPPGTSLLNSRLILFNDLNVEAARNDDGVDPETGYTALDSDSYLRFTFNRPGIFHIQVSDELTSRGGARYTYTLRARVLQQAPCTDVDGDGVSTCEGDCDDGDPAVHFGAPEICDGQDNDCNGVGDPEVCTGDFDGDGVSGIAGDCNDNDPTVRPSATEVCNDRDDNCDGDTDEGLLNACGTCGFPPAERCDGVDNDCDTVADEGCDADGDGDGFTPDEGDCVDSGAGANLINPGAAEVCDGIDNDCDGQIDEFVKNSCGQCAPEPQEACNGQDDNCNGRIDDGVVNLCGFCGPTPVEVCDGEDNDCDGDVDEDVTNACGGCGPVPLEFCDGQDNNCDGDVDEGCDADADGDGQTQRQGDCDDENANVRSGIAETCGDTLDANCDGDLDDGCAPRPESEANNTAATCDPLLIPGRVRGTVTQGDVDFYCFTLPVAGATVRFDVDARVNGSSLDAALRIYDLNGTTILASNNNEIVGGSAQLDPAIEFGFETTGPYFVEVLRTAALATPEPFYVLSTTILDGCTDLDRDGFNRCGAVGVDPDCDDQDATRNPGAAEVCNGIDDNCVGGVDETCVGDCLDDRFEQNDTPAQARPITPGSVSDLQFCRGDVDLYTVAVEAGDRVIAEILFDLADANLSVEILSPSGASLGVSPDTGNNESVEVTATETGTHFVRVAGPFNADAAYELVVLLP